MIRLAMKSNNVGIPEFVWLDPYNPSVPFRLFQTFCKLSLDYKGCKKEFYKTFCDSILAAEEVELSRELHFQTSEIVDISSDISEFQRWMKQWFK